MVSPKLSLILALLSVVGAQPSPDLQKRISDAIKNAANQSNPDYTAFVNPFIGTGELLLYLMRD